MVIHSADRRMQIYGALLLLPAAVLLGTFAYLPTVTTLINSFFLPGFRGAPPEFVGLENYAVLIEDATFWRVARNNLLYALGMNLMYSTMVNFSDSGMSCIRERSIPLLITSMDVRCILLLLNLCKDHTTCRGL